MLAEQFFILGTSRVEMTTEQFRAASLDAVKEQIPKDFDQRTWDAFALRLYYSTFDYGDPQFLHGVAERHSSPAREQAPDKRQPDLLSRHSAHGVRNGDPQPRRGGPVARRHRAAATS